MVFIFRFCRNFTLRLYLQGFYPAIVNMNEM
nr:MAG TPA: hypothetical protein [Caudoviricetes sp.]